MLESSRGRHKSTSGPRCKLSTHSWALWDWGLVATCMHVCSVAKSCQIFCDFMDCSPPGSSVHRILQGRVLEWVAIPSPGVLTNWGIEPMYLALAGRFFITEPLGKPGCNLKGPYCLIHCHRERTWARMLGWGKALLGSCGNFQFVLDRVHSNTSRRIPWVAGWLASLTCRCQPIHAHHLRLQ